MVGALPMTMLGPEEKELRNLQLNFLWRNETLSLYLSVILGLVLQVLQRPSYSCILSRIASLDRCLRLKSRLIYRYTPVRTGPNFGRALLPFCAFFASTLIITSIGTIFVFVFSEQRE
jgi:hypothetical protein